MAEQVAPEFIAFIDSERSRGRMPAATRALGEGEVAEPFTVSSQRIAPLLQVAARVASGLFRPAKHQEVVWVEGENELAVGFANVTARMGDGQVLIDIPVRCDQVGESRVEVIFVLGTPSKPRGLYAATTEKPRGLELIVNTWGDALVAFAWQCLLGLASGLAGASGKDSRGNLRIPVDLAASAKGLQITPMTRHRFAGSSQLKPATTKRGVAP